MNKKEFRKIVQEEVRKVLKEAYRDPQDNINILRGMMKKGGNEASMVKDILLDLKSEYNVTLDLNSNQSIAAAISNKEVADYLDNAVEDALDSGLGRMKTNTRPSFEGTEQSLNEGGTGIPESMWVKELIGKKIIKAFVKQSGPDLIIWCEDGSQYTLKTVAGLVKWNK